MITKDLLKEYMVDWIIQWRTNRDYTERNIYVLDQECAEFLTDKIWKIGDRIKAGSVSAKTPSEWFDHAP